MFFPSKLITFYKFYVNLSSYELTQFYKVNFESFYSHVSNHAQYSMFMNNMNILIHLSHVLMLLK